MKVKKIILSALIATVLSGCAHMNSDFDCPMKNGVRCQSLDEVNAAIDRGEISGTGALSQISSASYHDMAYSEYKDSVTGKYPVRYQEDVMRVWIAPFEDTDGNYHQASSVYTVTKPGYWIGNPAREIRGGIV